MERLQVRELAFFNLLKSFVSPNIKNESVDYVVQLEDLEQRMEVSHETMTSFIKKLENDGFVEITEESDLRVNLHFEKTNDKLLEFISVDEVESTINGIKDFIGRNIQFFDFPISKDYTRKYAEEALVGMEADGEDFDMTDIIERGANDIFNKESVITLVNKILFKISEKADEQDLNILESIIYCSFNLPVIENPFYITLFLTKICFEMEILKKSS